MTLPPPHPLGHRIFNNCDICCAGGVTELYHPFDPVKHNLGWVICGQETCRARYRDGVQEYLPVSQAHLQARYPSVCVHRTDGRVESAGWKVLTGVFRTEPDGPLYVTVGRYEPKDEPKDQEPKDEPKDQPPNARGHQVRHKTVPFSLFESWQKDK